MPQFLNVKQLYERLGASRAALSRWLPEWRMRHQVVDLIHRLLPWVKERLILLSRWLFRTWSPSWNTFALVGSAVFIGVPLLGTLLGYKPSTAILWATGLVVLAYTIEAYRMRLELVRQNEIAIQPLVIAVIGGPDGSRQFMLRNIGRGPALSIRVEDVTLPDVAGDNVPFIMKVQTMDYLEPQTERAPITELTSASSATPEAYFEAVPSLDPGTAVDSCRLTIEYDNIGGQLRCSLMQMGKGGIRLLGHGKGQ